MKRKYEIMGTPLYSFDYLIGDDEERAARDEEIMNTLLAHLKGRETIVAVEVRGCTDWIICDGSWIWSLYDMVDSLPIKDGIDMVRFDNGNLGLVAYYNGRESYLEIITDEEEVARIKDMLGEEDEEE